MVAVLDDLPSCLAKTIFGAQCFERAVSELDAIPCIAVAVCRPAILGACCPSLVFGESYHKTSMEHESFVIECSMTSCFLRVVLGGRV